MDFVHILHTDIVWCSIDKYVFFYVPSPLASSSQRGGGGGGQGGRNINPKKKLLKCKIYKKKIDWAGTLTDLFIFFYFAL